MTKKNKTEIKLPVEEVENFLNTFEYIFSCIEFWKLNNKYPGKLINYTCSQFINYLNKILHKQYWDKQTPKS